MTSDTVNDKFGPCEKYLLERPSIFEMRLLQTDLNRHRHMGRNGVFLRFDSIECFLFAVDQKEVSKFKLFRNGFHGEEVAAPSYRRACAGVCAFFGGECGVH